MKAMQHARTNFFKAPREDSPTDIRIESHQISLERVTKPHLTDRLNIITERFNLISKQLTQFGFQAESAQRELLAVKTPERTFVNKPQQPLFEDEPEFVFDFDKVTSSVTNSPLLVAKRDSQNRRPNNRLSGISLLSSQNSFAKNGVNRTDTRRSGVNRSSVLSSNTGASLVTINMTE